MLRSPLFSGSFPPRVSELVKNHFEEAPSAFPQFSQCAIAVSGLNFRHSSACSSKPWVNGDIVPRHFILLRSSLARSVMIDRQAYRALSILRVDFAEVLSILRVDFFGGLYRPVQPPVQQPVHLYHIHVCFKHLTTLFSYLTFNRFKNNVINLLLG